MHALRTPDSCFANLPGYDFAPHYVDIDGLRVHYLDEGPPGAPPVLMMHGEPSWSFLYRKMVAPLVAAGHRVVAPDLVGFGKSDKPKREAVHQLDWHRQVLLEWITRLDLRRIVLVLSNESLEPGTSLIEAAPERFAGMLVAELAGQSTGDAAWRAPFPDRGFEAARRAWGPGHGGDLPPRQARALAKVAMGYFAA